jgi:hypothetical protein
MDLNRAYILKGTGLHGECAIASKQAFEPTDGWHNIGVQSIASKSAFEPTDGWHYSLGPLC